MVELVALRRVAPRTAAQRYLLGLHPVSSAAERGGVVAARQPLPLNRYPHSNERDVVILRRRGAISRSHFQKCVTQNLRRSTALGPESLAQPLKTKLIALGIQHVGDTVRIKQKCAAGGQHDRLLVEQNPIHRPQWLAIRVRQPDPFPPRIIEQRKFMARARVAKLPRRAV